MIKELELSNEDHFIKCFDDLYEDITSEYNFDYTMEKINVQHEATQVGNLFSCCSNDSNFVYLNHALLENAIYDILCTNGIGISETKDTNIEFLLAKSKDEVIVQNGFGIHQDTGSKVRGNSYTIIIYLHTYCQGGELIFYEKKPSGDFEKTVMVEPNPSEASTTKVVIFDGEIFHKPEPFYNGQRCAIVCQVSK